MKALTAQDMKYRSNSKRKAKRLAQAKVLELQRAQAQHSATPVPEDITQDDNGFVRPEPTTLGKARKLSERKYIGGTNSKIFKSKAPSKRPECALAFTD